MSKISARRKVQPLNRAEERLAAGVQTIREASIFERDAFAAYPSALCQLSLPIRAQLGKSEFTARYAAPGGYFGFSIFTPVEYGIPFGAYPRAIFSYVYTTLMKQKDREEGDPRIIHMGASLRDCMQRITGKDHSKITGGPRGSQTLFERQLDSFVRSQMRFFYPRNSPGARSNQEHAFALFSHLATSKPTLFEMGGDGPRWETDVRASEDLFLDAIQHAMPVDYDVLSALWPSPLKIDQATWLSYRANELKGAPLSISWRALMAQFGGGYAPASHRGFRAEFREGIKAVQRVYDVDDPDCVRFEEDGDKVTLTVKRPMVPLDALRRTVFLPAQVPTPTPPAVLAVDPAQVTLFSLLAGEVGLLVCSACFSRYPGPSADQLAEAGFAALWTRCPQCQATTPFVA